MTLGLGRDLYYHSTFSFIRIRIPLRQFDGNQFVLTNNRLTICLLLSPFRFARSLTAPRTEGRYLSRSGLTCKWLRGTQSKVHRGGCTLVLSPDGQTGSAPHGGAAAWRWHSWALACVCMRGLVHTGGWLFPKACKLVLRYHRRMTGSQRRYCLPVPTRRINNNL